MIKKFQFGIKCLLSILFIYGISERYLSAVKDGLLESGEVLQLTLGLSCLFLILTLFIEE